MFTTAALPLQFSILRGTFFGLLLSLLAISSHAQGHSAELIPKTPAEVACLKALSKFELSFSLARQAQGGKAATELRERLLPAKLENEIMLREGPCGVTKYLHKKKLID